MPSTATITAFYSFSPLTTIRSAEVNANFSNFRGHFVPIEADTATASHLEHDLGATDHAWRGLYAQYGVFYQNTAGSVPASPSAGFVSVYAKNDAKLYIKTPAGVETQVGAGGGGAVPYRMYEPDSLGALKEVLASGLEVWNFANTDDQQVFLKFVVPEAYTAGTQIYLKQGKAFATLTSGNFLFKATSYIFKGNVVGTTTPTGYASTNVQQAVDATANEVVEIDDIDLTSASGQINSVSVAAGDTILVKLVRSASTETSGVAGDVRLIDESFEIDFTS
jgi:hypothetical protein